jgi:hypothetical protein
LPNAVSKKIAMNNVQVFVVGANLWEFTTLRKPLDPEAIQSGAIEYPMQRLFTFGINLSL